MKKPREVLFCGMIIPLYMSQTLFDALGEMRSANMSYNVRKRIFGFVRPAKIQISLRFRAV